MLVLGFHISSPRNPGKVVIVSCWQELGRWWALKIPGHGSIFTGLRKRKSPTGGLANGTPRNISRPVPITSLCSPCSIPLFVCTKMPSCSGILSRVLHALSRASRRSLGNALGACIDFPPVADFDHIFNKLIIINDKIHSIKSEKNEMSFYWLELMMEIFLINYPRRLRSKKSLVWPF